MKKLLLIILFFIPILVSAQYVLQGPQGGTNISTGVSGDVNKCLKVLSVNPLKWSVGTCGSTGGSGSDVNWTLFNGSGLYPSTTTNQVLIGDSSTTTRASLEIRALTTAGGSLTSLGSTTLQNFTFLNATGTRATTTSFAISGISSSLLKTNASGSVVPAVSGTDYQAAGTYVTAVSVASSNGFSGSSSGGATPALTLSTSITGVLKGNGTAISAASAGTDYEVPLTISTGLTRSTNTVTVNTSQNIATLSNLTGNGFVKTSGGTGALSIDTNTYITGNQSITLTGDVTGSGATSIASTLATVNSNVGAFTNANITVNAKGLITAAASGTDLSWSTTSANHFVNSSSTIANPAGGTSGNVIQWNGSKWVSVATSTLGLGGSGGGSVTSVDISVPTGLTISGNPITTSGTLAVSLASGYTIPITSTLWSTTSSQFFVHSSTTIPKLYTDNIWTNFNRFNAQMYIANDTALEFGGGSGSVSQIKTGSDGTLLYDVGEDFKIKILTGQLFGIYANDFTSNIWRVTSSGDVIQAGTLTMTGTSDGCATFTTGVLGSTGVACGGGGGGAYPFSLAGNATSTLTQFNGGLTAYASSTIGNGNQNGGLTISGNATTTGNLSVTGAIKANTLEITGTATSSIFRGNVQIDGSLNVTGTTFSTELSTALLALILASIATAVATFTNKRHTERVSALSANSATPAVNTDNFDVLHITGQTATITSFTTNLTGTPVNGDQLRISVTGTGAVALTFGAKFEAGAATLPTTTVSTTRLDMIFYWNTEGTPAWRCMAQG